MAGIILARLPVEHEFRDLVSAGDVEVVLRVERERLDRVRGLERPNESPVGGVDVDSVERFADVDAALIINGDHRGRAVLPRLAAFAAEAADVFAVGRKLEDGGVSVVVIVLAADAADCVEREGFARAVGGDAKGLYFEPLVEQGADEAVRAARGPTVAAQTYQLVV